MLLVDDAERQRAKLDVLLHQRMRADDQVISPRSIAGSSVAPLGRGDACRSAARRDTASPSSHLRQRAVVLLGEDLGRRHERDLEAVLHRDDRGQQRDDRLAGADVALQQPLHRPRLLHVGDDLGERLRAARRSA